MIVEYITTFLYTEGIYSEHNGQIWLGISQSFCWETDMTVTSPSSDGQKDNSTTKIKYRTYHSYFRLRIL